VDFCAGETLPAADVDLAPRRVWSGIESGEFSGLQGAWEIRREHDVEFLAGKSLTQGPGLCLTLRREEMVAVALPYPGGVGVGLAVSNERDLDAQRRLRGRRRSVDAMRNPQFAMRNAQCAMR